MDNRSGISANGRGRNGVGGGSVSSISIPAASMKIIHGLKEIVNCPEQEIYAMLKECNMDPNEAISRLISQDPFHEVKSKHDRKKASKDTTESKPRSTSTSNRGSRGAERHAARTSSNQSSSYDSGVLHGRSYAHKKDGGQNFSNFSSASRGPSSSYNSQLPISSDSAPLGNTISDEGSDFYSSSQPSSTCHPSWLGAPGQLSMAEVVRMGRSQVKSSSTLNKYEETTNGNNILASASTSQFHDNFSSTVSQTVEVGVDAFPRDEWPLYEQTTASSVNLASELPGDENLNGHEGSSVLNAMDTENFDAGIEQDDNAYEGVNSFHSPRYQFESREGGADSASFGEKLEQLNLEDDKEAQPEDDKNSVKIPTHLQVHTEDFSHLSFGSFGSAPVGGLNGPFSSVKNDGASSAIDASPVEISDTKNAEYFINEHSTSLSIENYNGQSSSSHEPSSVSSPEQLKSETHEATQKDQYSFPSSTSGYSPESTLHLNPSLEFSNSASQILNKTSFSDAMVNYLSDIHSNQPQVIVYGSMEYDEADGFIESFPNSLPNSLLMTPSNQASREAEFPFSPFSILPTPPPKYNNVAVPVSSSPSSIPSPPSSSLPLPEVQKSVPSNLNSVQTLLRSGAVAGASLPHNHHNHHHHQQQQHHPYTQPAIPVTHFANMIGYPLLPQTYPYVPPAFQHMFNGTNSYHHSVPQQPHSAMVAAAASAYSNFANSGGNFAHNPAGGSTIGASSTYDDVILSQYKEENAGMWGQRTGVGSNPYYNMEGVNPSHANMRQQHMIQQQQQQQQQYGVGGGYPNNVYHSVENQQMNGRDGGAQGQQQQQGKQQQMWQSSY